MGTEGMEKLLLAIDPGTTKSGYAVIDMGDYKPLESGKVENEAVFGLIERPDIGPVAIEMVASYGMSVGREVFETCVWIGRFREHAVMTGKNWDTVYRQEEKLAICHSPRANDTTIRQALVDRFCALGTPNHGKGTKKEPGWFYGFKADAWQAYAVGVTYIDRKQTEERTNGVL